MVNEGTAKKIIDREIEVYEESLRRSRNLDLGEPTYNEAFIDGALYVLKKLKRDLALEG